MLDRKLTDEEMEGWQKVYHDDTHQTLLKPPRGEKKEKSAKKGTLGMRPDSWKGWDDFLSRPTETVEKEKKGRKK